MGRTATTTAKATTFDAFLCLNLMWRTLINLMWRTMFAALLRQALPVMCQDTLQSVFTVSDTMQVI